MKTVFNFFTSLLCILFLTLALNDYYVSSSSQSLATEKPDMAVQLAIFSGVPDPQWKLTSTSSFYDAIALRLKHFHSGHLPSILGYKGLLVTMSDRGSRVTLAVPRHSDKVLENLLLDTAPSDLDNRVKEMARKSISGDH